MSNSKLSTSKVAERRLSRVVFGYALLFSSACFFLLQLWELEKKMSHLDEALGFVFVWGFPLMAVLLAKLRLRLELPASSSGRHAVVPFALADDSSRIRAQRWGRKSLALPLFALPLILPLSLHFLVYVAAAGPMNMSSSSGFALWIALSAAIVGHAHLALALFGVYYAKRRAEGRPFKWAGMFAWSLAILVAAIPGAILYLIPPILVALSGIFIPVMYYFAGLAWDREEDALNSL